MLSYEKALESCVSESERNSITMQMQEIRNRIEEEKSKREMIRRESNRRRHNMLPFVIHLIKWLHEKGVSFT